LKLIPFDKAHLRIGEPLPFGLRDETGRLLLGAGAGIASVAQLEALAAQRLYADEHEAADWHRRLAAAMDAMLRQNAPLKAVVAVRPERGARDAGAAAARMTLGEQWEDAVLQLDAALRDAGTGGSGTGASDWLARLHAVHARARALMAKRPDASLYTLVYDAAHSTEKYSSHHAMLSMLICELAAPLLEWPAAAIDSLGRAALTMNVAMLRLQDQLACSELPLSAAMRAEIEVHPEAGASLLERGGFDDRLALEVVRRHHEPSDPELPLATLPPARQLARLLRRVDIFSAKISRRATRAPMSPVQAAREACLGAGGVPDEIGGALLKAVGIYPPGSFVELASGELGIVVARGRRANLPYVASLVAPSGTPLGEPALRDTIDRRFNVKAAVPPGQVRVRPPHERLLAMR
jgi:HD-GYP domain-containing protein (c-di-GMP phosphodiesterase class II)